MDAPLNADAIEMATLRSTTSDDAAWTGGYFAYGGSGTDRSAVVRFTIPPGKRLGRHTDTAEETQFIRRGSGEILLDAGAKPIEAGDVIVLTEGTAHDLRNTGDEDLEVIGFFAAPAVQQLWSTEVWEPGDLKVTGTPNA